MKMWTFNGPNERCTFSTNTSAMLHHQNVEYYTFSDECPHQKINKNIIEFLLVQHPRIGSKNYFFICVSEVIYSFPIFKQLAQQKYLYLKD